MATPYSDIYDKFTTMFTDANLASLTQATFEELLEIWLGESADIHFKECRTDLTDRDDTANEFNNTLTGEEQWIIAYGMNLSWLASKIADENKLKNRIGDRDYQVFSPANLLSKLEEVRDAIEWKLELARLRYNEDTVVIM